MNKITVDAAGNWKLYTNTLPANSTPLGTVTRDGFDTGALVRIESTGLYAQVNAGAIRSLDGRTVAAALGTAGRPSEMDGGKRVNVYLDADSLAIAAKLGDGNVSEGIRKALKITSLPPCCMPGLLKRRNPRPPSVDFLEKKLDPLESVSQKI